MNERRIIDVSKLPGFAFAARDPLWWGLTLLLVIEGMVFALLLVTYFYLRGNEALWPPMAVGRPAFAWATAGMALYVASVVPMVMTDRAANAGSLLGMRRGLIGATLLGLAGLFCRAMEMATLTFRWDSSAHGSVFWTLIGLHLAHAIIDVFENLMLIALLYLGPVEQKHRVDVNVNCFYWYFVAGWWLVLYAILYGDALLFAKGWGGA